MKFLRFLMNVGLLIFVAISITLSQCLIYNVLSWQSKSTNAIHLASPDTEDVNYIDIYGFWMTDIAGSYEAGAKYRIRNWFSWSWWNSGMKWADTALDWTISTIKPLVVPIAQVNALAEFYDRDLSYFVDDILLESKYHNEEELSNALFEYFIVYENETLDDNDFAYFASYSDDTESLTPEKWEYTGNNEFAFAIAAAAEEVGALSFGEYTELDRPVITEAAFGQWVRVNKVLYNYTWKIEKYNNPCYAGYFEKFVNVTYGDNGNETRTIKTAIVVLYTTFFVSNILALIFVIKYPINFWQARFVGRHKDISTI